MDAAVGFGGDPNEDGFLQPDASVRIGDSPILGEGLYVDNDSARPVRRGTAQRR